MWRWILSSSSLSEMKKCWCSGNPMTEREFGLGVLVGVEEVVSRDSGLIAHCEEGGTFELLMVRHGERCVGAVGIVTHHGDVVAFANNVEPEGLKRLDDARLGRVNL